MTTLLSQILDIELLDRDLADGYIREQIHPDFPYLSIFNYTEKTQFEKHWTPATKMARGLIVNSDTDEVLARPFQKIHNWDEPEAPGIDWDAPIFSSSNKFDGSLGIMYIKPNGQPALATRGSFASEQAIKGTEILLSSGMAWEYAEWIDAGYTPLFEIIYPDNRIVLDYGDQEFLAPLGKIHIETGKYLPAQRADHTTFRDAALDLSRSNAEGWVVWLSDNKAVKVKQADYVELHRIVTGLNRKSVWKAALRGPVDFNDWASQLPDELYAWANGVRDELLKAVGDRIAQLDTLYIAVLESDVWEDDKIVRANFAREAKRIAGRDAGYMFSFLDNKDVLEKVWKEIEPKGDER